MTNIKRFSGAIVCLLLFALVLPVLSSLQEPAEAKGELEEDPYFNVEVKMTLEMSHGFDEPTRLRFPSLVSEWNNAIPGYSFFTPTVSTSSWNWGSNMDGRNRIYKDNVLSEFYPGIAKLYGETNQYMHLISLNTKKHVPVVTEADILINIKHPFTDEQDDTAYNVYTVLMHEIGHIFGMEHQSSSTSVMSVSDKGVVITTLSFQDKNNLYRRLVIDSV